LANEPGVILQGTGTQSHFKISYRLEEGIAPKLSVIKRILREQKLSAKVILSSGIFLDIIPIRAGDGLALRHACFRWDLPFSRVMVAGDSGNDIEMLMGDTLGLVVGNYSPELKKLKGRPRIHFAEQHHARGILEGIDYYDFFNHVVIPNDHLV
jgi:sucrose-phosphate synthase